MNTGFQRKHVLVTGASSGIGFQSISLFLAEGAWVTACYKSNPSNLETLKDSYSERLNVVKVDVRNDSEVASLFSEANAVFGRVDASVVNAGIAFADGVTVYEMSMKQWQETIAVNLTGAFLCAKYFFINLKKYPGDDASLVFVGSTAGEIGQALYSDYSASKAGLRGLMMALKNEIVGLAVRGRVNLVNPGWTVTPMTEKDLSNKADVSRILQTIPLRKVATPSDIAHAIMYLSSDKLAGHVSGQTITVAGGMEGRVLFSREEIEEYIK
ncbi:MAG: SDR family oxidoreductase [Deltaproteobacteria bacterium]|nr:SDR family oxidoreductase [Deltaproteobacteria bacterium]